RPRRSSSSVKCGSSSLKIAGGRNDPNNLNPRSARSLSGQVRAAAKMSEVSEFIGSIILILNYYRRLLIRNNPRTLRQFSRQFYHYALKCRSSARGVELPADQHIGLWIVHRRVARLNFGKGMSSH